MSKYQINYNRVVPQHRLTFDHLFVQKTRNPLQYFKQYKNGFNHSWVKYYHIHLCGLSLVLFGAVIIYQLGDSNAANITRDKLRKYPGLHFLRQHQQGNRAPYDNLLRRYVNDPLGNKDQPFQEY